MFEVIVFLWAWLGLVSVLCARKQACKRAGGGGFTAVVLLYSGFEGSTVCQWVFLTAPPRRLPTTTPMRHAGGPRPPPPLPGEA